MAVVLQANRQAMPQEWFLTMGCVVMWGMGDEEEVWCKDHWWMEFRLVRTFPQVLLAFLGISLLAKECTEKSFH